MDDLSSKILRAESMDEIDALLEDAFSEVEFIGELDINEEAFAKIAEVLRSECRFGGRIQRRYLRPATFVSSLVFSARYSQDAIRSFWQPYAEDVWNIEYSDEFYRTCRSGFFSSRHHLAANFDLDLYGRRYGDVVYPVYRHAIIPRYLHDDFARWFVSCLEIVRGLNREQLGLFVRHPDITRYIAPTLKTFLVSSDTHNVALDIIQELCDAIDLLAEGHDSERIRELLLSLIQRELWDRLCAELSTRDLARSKRQRHTRVEWIWSCELEDWELRLRNLTADRHQKPTVCIWSKANESEAFDDYNGKREYISPDLQADGQWYKREIPIEVSDQPDMPAGSIYVFDENRRCIFKQPVPQLPEDEFQFYRITQQGTYAVPIKPGQLVSGECLVSYQGGLQLLDTDNQVISPLQTDYYVSEIMRESVGHDRIERYKIDLPIKVIKDDTEVPVAGRQRRTLRACLSDKHRIAHTSASSPPVYSSNEITLTLSEIPVSIATLNLHISTPTGQLYESLPQHVEQDGECYHLHLQDLIPSDRIGTYTVDITRGFRSRLDSPVEFSVLPNLLISSPDEGVFHPRNPFTVTVTNAANVTVESPDNSTDIDKIGDSDWEVTWRELRSRHCAVQVRQGDVSVTVDWTIRRIYSWIENGTRESRLHPEDLATAKIQFRGLKDSQLQVVVGDKRHTIHLSARGEETIDLSTDRFQDILLSQRTSEVPIKLLLDGDEWQFGTFVRRPQITHFLAEYVIDDNGERFRINVTLSESLQANYQVQIINVEDQKIYVERTFDSLPETIELDEELPNGTYSILICANGEKLQIPSPNVIEIAPPSVDIEASYEDFRLRFDYVVDNWRPGNYELMLLDSDEACLLSESINPLGSPFIAQVDQVMRGCDYDILITWKEQVVGQTTLFVPPPAAAICSADYKDSTITVAYKVDNSRPGEYALEVMVEDHNMVISYVLNQEANRFDGAANLARGSRYLAQIQWNGNPIGLPFPFHISRWGNLSIRGIVWIDDD